MYRRFSLILILAVALYSVSTSQNITNSDSIPHIEKPRIPNEDINEFLSRITKYPVQALKGNIQGNVLVSFSVELNGQLSGLKVESSPDNTLSVSSIDATKTLTKTLTPARQGNNPVVKQYYIAFIFRIETGSEPADYKTQARKTFEKGKYEKSLVLLNRAIDDNPYDSGLFVARAEVKEKLGDTPGAIEDKLYALNLEEDFLTKVNVTAHVVSRTVLIDSRVVEY
jgi:hypothetical protein